jgi:hypothetical protein
MQVTENRRKRQSSWPARLRRDKNVGFFTFWLFGSCLAIGYYGKGNSTLPPDIDVDRA